MVIVTCEKCKYEWNYTKAGKSICFCPACRNKTHIIRKEFRDMEADLSHENKAAIRKQEKELNVGHDLKLLQVLDIKMRKYHYYIYHETEEEIEEWMRHTHLERQRRIEDARLPNL